MKKIYILTAIFALLTLSLNAQTLASKFGTEAPPKAPSVKAPNRAVSVTVNENGTATNEYIPVYGYFSERTAKNQMIYTASQLNIPTGSQITSLKFYTSSGFTFNGGTMTVSLGSTTESSFSSQTALSSNWTQVASFTPSYSNVTEWTINFTSNYLYTGGNLIVQIEHTGANSGTVHSHFYGAEISNMSLYSYEGYNGTSATRYSFQPKATFNYIEATTDPTIYASPSSINFNSTPGVPVNETVVVTSLNLSTGITASVSGQDANLFSVSPVSLGTSGGNLTVTYSPTAAGTHTAKITLSSTGAQDVEIDLNGSCVNEWTVCDGTSTNSNLPIFGNYAEQLQINQMIYPASMLTNLVGKNITSMTFYANGTINAKLGDDTWSVKLGTTNETSYGSNSNDVTRLATSDEVYLGYLTTGSNTLTITFANPFNYTGGNLVVDFQEMVTSGDFSSTTFYGKTQDDDYTGFYSRTGTTTNQDQVTLTNGRYPTCTPYKFLPKVTFGFEDDTNPKIEVSPNTLTISDSGTNNTFTVQGSNLGDNVGVTVPQGSEFSTTTSDQWWGFEPNNGSVNGTVTVTYNGRALSATETVTAANNQTSATVDVTYVADLYIVTDNGVTGNWDFTNGTQQRWRLYRHVHGHCR